MTSNGRILEVIVTQYPGIVGDYNTDCQPGLQALIDKCPNGVRFIFPAGSYRVGAPVDFTRLGNWSMDGEGPENSRIIMHAADLGPCVRTTRNIFSCRDIAFTGNLTAPRNPMPGSAESVADQYDSGIGFWFRNCQGAHFLNCKFGGQIGCYGLDPFLACFDHCMFNGSNGCQQDNGSIVGCVIFGATDVSFIGSCDATGWREGLRLAGSGVNLHSMRFEVNGIGARLGFSPEGYPSALAASSFVGVTLEANDIGIRANVLSGSSFNGIAINGTGGSPSAGSVQGVDLQTLAYCNFSAMRITGWYKDSSLFLRSSHENHHLVFQAVDCDNGNAAGKKWDVPGPIEDSVLFQACNHEATYGAIDGDAGTP